jgi:tetratricopeptide (TPR) repeat protein
MKTRIFRFLTALSLILALAVSLTGCDTLDYRKAVGLYNAGKYDSAAEIFNSLGGYEDSAALYTLSQYRLAVALAERGSFDEALPRFLKLGNYENSAQWALECKYQIAVTAYNEARFTDAENCFRETSDYKQTGEYRRRIHWLALYDAVAAAGFDNGSGFILEKQVDGKDFSICANKLSQELILSASKEENEDFLYLDTLSLTLTPDSTVASFACSSVFGMDYLDRRIGSTQHAAGKIDMTTCTPETRLVIETYEKHVEDNLGNVTDTADPSENRMANAMAENLSDLLSVIPALLAEAGIEQTLRDIGFYAL